MSRVGLTAPPIFETHLGFVLTAIAVVLGAYLFVYLPKQKQINKTVKKTMSENTLAGAVNAAKGEAIEKTASIMAPTPATPPTKSTKPITKAELAECDGSNPDKPVYVAIKGDVFDVTEKKQMYGPGASYNVFAGKDGSFGLGKSSLKPEDAHSDYSKLEPSELKVLNDWYVFFEKRYKIAGKVVD